MRPQTQNACGAAISGVRQRSETCLRLSLRGVSIAVLILLGTPTAHAAIEDHGDYILDTESGLKWLDLNLTRNMSYNEVLAQLPPGGNLRGCRVPTKTERQTLFARLGLSPTGGTWPSTSGCFLATTTYCGPPRAGEEEALENAIRLLGDTQDSDLDASGAALDVSPSGAGAAKGHVGDATMTLVDSELVNRADGTPASDAADDIRSSGPILDKNTRFPDVGTVLVCDTWPITPLPPLPTPDANHVTLFDNLAPSAIGLTTDCPFQQCGGSSAEGWGGSTFEDGGGGLPTQWFQLSVTSAFDAQARPWMRITGFDFTPANSGGGCVPGNIVSHSGNRLTIIDIGSNRCRVTIDTEFSYMPSAMATLGNSTFNAGYIANTYIDYSAATGGPYWGWGLDNVTLEFISGNIAVDYKPGNSENTIRPKSPGWSIYLAINTTSKAAGDAYDFNAADADPSTLRVGPGMAPVLTTQTGDPDGDGDIDYIYSFNTGATGIDCLDTHIAISGRTYSGDPIAGRDVIVPVNCEELVDIDIDPFNAANRVRPNDSYQVTVGILGMSTANGDAKNFDATQVDPATLKFGPGEAPNSSAPITGDLDADGNTDLLVGFSMYDSAIACGDTEVQMTGALYSGLPIIGSDSIETIDCETGGCHP